MPAAKSRHALHAQPDRLDARPTTARSRKKAAKARNQAYHHAGLKRSGLGGDDGKHGMLEFTQTRLVGVKY